MVKNSVTEIFTLDVPEIGKVRFEYGATRDKFEELYEKSQEQFMLEWAEDDERIRFHQPSLGVKRFTKDKTNIMLTAVTEKDAIAGVALCRKTELRVDTAEHEIITRVYDDYRNKGIGGFLLDLIHDTSDIALPKSTYFITAARNQKAYEIGLSYGYSLVDPSDCKPLPSSSGLLAMARSIKLSKNRSEILR